jgi:ribonuclease P protein component
MAVSRQVDKRAVGRNRIKRVVRESFRQYFRDSRRPLDFVVLPRRETATMSNERLSESLCAHWARLERRGSAATAG